MRRPDFFLVGAPKCRTSVFSHYLGQRPDVFLGPKEPHYFALEFRARPLSVLQYVAYFDGATTEGRVVEASVRYLCCRSTPGRTKAFCPD